MDTFSSELADIYDIVVGDNSGYYDAILAAIQKRFPGMENAVVADIGGGTGLFAYHICDRVKRVLIIDPSDAMRKKASEKLSRANNVEIRPGGLPGCGLAKDSIDVIVIIGTFQYLAAEKHPAALRDVYRSLRRGGLAFLDLTNFFALIGRDMRPSTRKFNADGLKIIERDHNQSHPFREEWVDTYDLTLESPGGGVKRFESRHVLKMLSPTEMRLLLRQAGFSDVEVIPQQNMDEEMATKMWCFAKKCG